MRVLAIDPGTLIMGYGVVDEVGQSLLRSEDAVSTNGRHILDRPRLSRSPMGIDELTPVEWGVFKTGKQDDIGTRLLHLYQELMSIIQRVKPQEVAVEEALVVKNPKSAIAVGQAQGVVLLSAAYYKIPLYRYAPTKVKRMITDYGGSSKEQVREMVRVILGLEDSPDSLDAADALAVAICHLHERKMARMVSQV